MIATHGAKRVKAFADAGLILQRGRAVSYRVRTGPFSSEPFDPERGYGNWFWGITPSALRAMLDATGFAIAQEHLTPFHATVVAYPGG